MIKEYTLEQPEEWDKVVRSFQNYDVYYLSGYVKAFEWNGDGRAVLVSYVSEDQSTRGVNVVMKRDIHDFRPFAGRIAPGELFDIATPYGYGGWLIEGDGTEGLFYEYGQWARRNRMVSEFVRFHPVIGNQLPCGPFYEVCGLGGTVAVDLTSQQAIWDNLTSKNRNMVRKALKNGVKVYNGRYPEIFRKFQEIYNATMDKDHADPYYYFGQGFYSSILEDLPQNAQIFYAQTVDGTVAAGAVMIGANGFLNYHLSGSVQEYAPLAAANLLLYRAALWGCENGYRTLHLGGGVGGREDSLFKFKKAFYKGNPHRFYIGKKIFDEKAYRDLLEIRQLETDFDMGTAFFPGYRGGDSLLDFIVLEGMQFLWAQVLPCPYRRAA